MKYLSIGYTIHQACLIFALSLLMISGCKQEDWLDVKSNKRQVTPKSLSDLQAVLDNAQVMNSYGSILGLVGTDNIVIDDATLNALDPISKNAYLWAADLLEGQRCNDWTFNYQQIAYANIVLDGLPDQTGSVSQSYNNIKGSALFYRAFGHYRLAQLFCAPYQSQKDNSGPGIPLKLSSNVDEKPGRGTVSQTYQQIINDLKEAVLLLPETPQYRTRPSSVAANALLAKVYLAMQDYNNALIYADNALKSYGALLDYNTLPMVATNPFPTYAKGHPEIIFYTMTYGTSTVWSSTTARARVSPSLLSKYESNDLRKAMFYTLDATARSIFKGSYSAQSYNFDGIATDELYLIRAECLARSGQLNDALKDLNLLLKNRYATSSFKPYSTIDQVGLILKIIEERRKEMPYTGNLRWEDLRRLNLEPPFAVTLSRTTNNKTIQLLPNENRYTLPIPNEEVTVNNIQQNPR
ncbi:RagB/SusD family nutrient uptake outer membrane protein [Mucilaginibacter sp. PAMB04168]|uniref:RagB/SusD family nutrient uptake outer membrane protein n=1 Tax=Mucilaginibacter sp. PAMB04168 TaxID=3138567 RepID=UPI0031F6FDB9